MSSGLLILGLALIGVTWVSAYFSFRSPPRPPFGQYRESPIFQPKSRASAAAIATVLAAVLALAFFADKS